MQLHECLGSALGALGPETFLGLLPLNLEAEDLSEANVWLFPILKQYTIGAHLSFFTDSVLGMIGLMKQKSRKVKPFKPIRCCFSLYFFILNGIG